MSNVKQTLSTIKPDAVERNLDGQIKEEFLNNGFKIIQEKKITFSKNKIKKKFKLLFTPSIKLHPFTTIKIQNRVKK